MKKIAIILFSLLILSHLYAYAQEPYPKVKFYWDFKLNQNFTIDKYTTQTIIKNGKIIQEKLIKDYIIFMPVRKSNSFYHLKGNYYSYSKSLAAKSVFQLKSAYNLNFHMSERGEYKVPKNYTQPTIRNIPLFPEESISPGDMWIGEGIEILEFKPEVILPIPVNYQFVGFENKFEKKLAKITYNYLWNHLVDHKYTEIPYKFIGNSYHTLWYDTDAHLPVYTENLYDLAVIYYNGEILQYKGELIGYYNLKRTVAEKEAVKNEIYDKLKEADEKIEIKKDKDNLIINFGEIYFKFDSFELNDMAKEKLSKIGEVLKNYKNSRILTKGHTDNIGTDQYNQNLSERRAKSVLEYLINNNYIDKNQSSYTGMGHKEPLYNNRTENGRNKNRRVEIIITPE